jgi:hypothetical protein
MKAVKHHYDELMRRLLRDGSRRNAIDAEQRPDSMAPPFHWLMKRLKSLFVIIPFAIVTFMLGPVLWPPAGSLAPTPAQLPFLIGISAIEAIAFGIGVWFLLTTWPLLRIALPRQRNLAIAAYYSIGWMLLSWWPHDNLHIHNGENMQGLIYIEYGFHATLIAAAFIVARFFYAMLRQQKGTIMPA